MSSKKDSQGQDGLRVEQWPIERLIPYARNPRKNEEQVERMASAIREFGFRIPIVARSDGSVVDGHLRLKAAQRLGLKEVPVALADELTETQVKAFRLLANKSANWAEWDEELLKLELVELKDMDFDLELTGFTAEEMGDLWLKWDTEAAPQEEEPEKPVLLSEATLEDLAPSEEERAEFKDKKIIVEFSGGKDSSTAALWVKTFFPENETELCFVDMGADYEGLVFFLRDFAKALGLKLKILRSKQNIIDVLLDKGRWPHFMFPYCHEILHETFDVYMEQHRPEEIVIVRGGRLAEKNSQKGKRNPSRWLEIERMKEYKYFQPLYFAKKEVGVDLLTTAGVPIWEGYGFGLCRTACRICPGQKPAGFAAIRAQYPEVWAEIKEMERRLGTGYWQDSTPDKSATCDQMADRGEAAFAEGNFPPRFR